VSSRDTEAIYHLVEKPKSILIGNMPRKNTLQNCMVDVCKEFPDVALEHPACSGIVPRYLPSKFLESAYSPVCPLINATGIGIVDEVAVKIWIQGSIECVVNETVAHMCLVDITRLWVVDLK
jgi:hypothetical protein